MRGMRGVLGGSGGSFDVEGCHFEGILNFFEGLSKKLEEISPNYEGLLVKFEGLITSEIRIEYFTFCCQL